MNPVAEHGEHVAVIDAGADHDADPGAVKRKPHGDADDDRRHEDDDAHGWIAQENHVAARSNENNDGRGKRPVQIIG